MTLQSQNITLHHVTLHYIAEPHYPVREWSDRAGQVSLSVAALHSTLHLLTLTALVMSEAPLPAVEDKASLGEAPDNLLWKPQNIEVSLTLM